MRHLSGAVTWDPRRAGTGVNVASKEGLTQDEKITLHTKMCDVRVSNQEGLQVLGWLMLLTGKVL